MTDAVHWEWLSDHRCSTLRMPTSFSYDPRLTWAIRLRVSRRMSGLQYLTYLSVWKLGEFTERRSKFSSSVSEHLSPACWHCSDSSLFLLVHLSVAYHGSAASSQGRLNRSLGRPRSRAHQDGACTYPNGSSNAGISNKPPVPDEISKCSRMIYWLERHHFSYGID